MAAYLNTTLIPRIPCYREFLDTMVRRNVPDLGIPPIISRLIWVEQTVQEKMLLQGLKNLSPTNTLMACNHFHLAGVIRQFAGNDENLTIAEVSKNLQDGRLRSIKNLEKEKVEKEAEIAKWERDVKETEKDEALPENKRRQRRRNEETRQLEKPWPRNYENERRVLTNKIEVGNEFIGARTEKIRSIQSQHKFFNDLVKMMSELKPMECPICTDEKVFFDF
jgi:hypothetical protein